MIAPTIIFTDDAVINEEVKKMVPFVRAICRNYYNENHDMDSIYSAALVGAWEAVRKWNGLGELSGWAGKIIHRRIQDHLRAVNGRSDVAKMKRAAVRPTVFLDAPMSEGDDITLGMVIKDENTKDSLDILLGMEVNEYLCKLISKLKPQEQFVINRNYFDGLKLKAIADELNVTEARICQIRKAALYKLRTLYEQQITWSGNNKPSTKHTKPTRPRTIRQRKPPQTL